jgi:hypothetical protein
MRQQKIERFWTRDDYSSDYGCFWHGGVNIGLYIHSARDRKCSCKALLVLYKSGATIVGMIRYLKCMDESGTTGQALVWVGMGEKCWSVLPFFFSGAGKRDMRHATLRLVYTAWGLGFDGDTSI